MSFLLFCRGEQGRGFRSLWPQGKGDWGAPGHVSRDELREQR